MYSFHGSQLRVVVPRTLRPEILNRFHSAHQGVLYSRRPPKEGVTESAIQL